MPSVDDELELELENARFQMRLLEQDNEALRQANALLRTTIASILRIARRPYDVDQGRGA